MTVDIMRILALIVGITLCCNGLMSWWVFLFGGLIASELKVRIR